MIDGEGRDWRCRNRGHQKRHMWTSSSHHPHHYLSLSSVMATSKEPPPPRLLPFTTTTAFHPSVLTLLFLILLLLPSTIINASSNLPHSSPSFERCFPRTLSPSTVKIKYGSLKGLIVHLSSSSSSSSSTSSSSFSPRLAPVEVFLGVPYASPPTGALRFMPPVTPGHWRGTRLATRLAPSCPQPPLSVLANATSHAHYEWLKRMAARTANQSEDCLYLNIYTAIVDLDAISGKDVDAASLADDEKDFEDDHGGDGMSADEAGERDDAEVFVENNDGNGGDDQPSRRRRSITSSNTPNSGVNRHRRHRSAANGSNASSSSGNSSPSRASRSSPSLSSSSSSSSSSASSTKSKTKTSSSFSSSSSFNSRRSAASLPVIVLLVSASHATNLGPQLDGSLLASYGQVVVVTLSYRLGALGFLPAQVDGILRGNYGLLDIVAGLHWLQQNIAAFGGQPANVTLIGHGHGAALAHILALSPMAKGLFNRVVLMSGSALAPWAIARDSPTYAKQVARQLSCPVESPASMVDCLRSASVASLMSASVTVPEHLSAFGPSIDAIVMPHEPRVAMTAALLARGVLRSSGEDFSGTTASSSSGRSFFYRSGFNSSSSSSSTLSTVTSSTSAFTSHHRLHAHLQSSASVGSSGYQPNSFTSTSSTSNSSPWPDFLIGLTRVECPAIFSPLEERTGLSTARRDRILRTLVRNSFDYHQQAIFHTLVNEYTDWTRPAEQPAAVMDSLVELLADAAIVAPSTETADHVAALGAQMAAAAALGSSASSSSSSSSSSGAHGRASSSGRGGKTTVHGPRTYLYVFNHQPFKPATTFYSRLGAPTGADLAYLLGVPLLPPQSLSTFSCPSSFSSTTNTSPRYPSLDVASFTSSLPSPASVFNYTEDDVQLAKEMIKYMLNFAAFGDPNSFPTTSSPPPANSHWSSSSSSADAAAHLRRLSSLHFEHVHGHVDGTTAAISSSSSSFSHSSAVNTGYPSSVHWPAYDTTQKKYLEFGPQITVRDHYRSHQLSIWLSLIPRLTIPSEIEEKERLQHQQHRQQHKSSSPSGEGNEVDSEEEGDQGVGSGGHLLRHHLLVDHGNPNSYEGEVKGGSSAGGADALKSSPSSGKWSRLQRANLSEALDWQQSLLYGRLVHAKVVRGGGGNSGPGTLHSSNAGAVPGNEQFAGRRAEQSEKRGEGSAGGNAANSDNGGAGGGDGGSVVDQSSATGGESAGQPSGSQMNMDLVHFADSNPEMDKNLLFESDSVDGYSTALMITIVVGCSLLVLNVIVFLGFYCQVEGGNNGKSGQRRRSKVTEEGDELSQLNATDQCEEGGKTDDPLLLQESVNLSSFDNSPHHHQQQQQPHHHHHPHPHHPHHQVQHNHPRQHNNLSTSRRGSTDTTLQSSNNQSHSHLLITSSSHNSASLSYSVVSGNEGSGNNDYRNGIQTPRAEHHHNHPQQQQQQQHQHQHRYSTLPGRRDRTKQCGQTVTVANIDTHHPSNNSGNINYGSSSTLTRIRQNPTEQWNRQQQQQQQFTINSNAASSQNIPCSEGAALYYVHYPPPPPLSQQQQHAEIVNAGEFEVAAFLDGMNTTAAAHCTSLKSILKHHQVQNGSGAQALLASPLYGTAAGSELGGTTTADPTSSLAIFEGTTVHYIPAGNSTVSVGNGANTGATTTATINGTEYIDGGNFITFLPPPPPMLHQQQQQQPLHQLQSSDQQATPSSQ